ncbi:MAG: glycosyl hydrolase family 8 [Bacteroidales bacterium]
MSIIKNTIIVLLLLLSFVSFSQEFKTDNSTGNLLDANGNNFIMKGINIPLAWYVSEVTNSIPALKTNTGINCARIVVETTTNETSWQNCVEACIANDIIPMVELHDATGSTNTADIQNMADFWIQHADYLTSEAIRPYILINICNEWGTWNIANTSGDQWRDGFNQAVTSIRNAGITSTLVIDGVGYGQDIDDAKNLRQYASGMIANDPEHNLLFSIHMYCEWAIGGDDIPGTLQWTRDNNIPFIIGEFGYQHATDGSCDIDEDLIMEECANKGIGWLAWSQKGNSGGVEYLDLCNDWTCSDWSDWGTSVFDGTYGTKTGETCSVFSELGAYYTDEYRNMFSEVLGKTEAEVDTKVETAFQDVFYGTDDQKLYFEADNNSAYILDVNNNDVRTEGMSYGMMICLQLDKKEEFDKLWNWAKTNMQYPASSSYEGYFAWQCNTNGSWVDGETTGPAPDGEAYFVTALYFASHRWGDSTGIYNYSAEAEYILENMLNKDGTDGVYNMFDETTKLITFVPYYDSRLHTDPSYNLPGFFDLWWRWTDTNQAFWEETPEAARKLIRDASHTTSGLTTDYSNFDGTPYEASFNTDSDRFMYDAWRTIMNLGMDYHWFRTDEQQPVIAERYLQFFENQGANYPNHYDWDGANPDGSHSTGLVACNAVASLAVDNQSLTEPFVQELWDIGAPTGTYRYYDGMLYMLALLNCSGDFKIWKPTEDVTATITAQETTCCEGDSVLLTAHTENEYTYQWNKDGTALSGETAHMYYAKTSGEYTVTVSNGTSTATSTAISVTVTPTPNPPTISSPVLYSVGETADMLTAIGSNLMWYTSQTSTGNTTAPTPSTDTADTTSYFVTQTSTGCESDFATIEVIVEETEITQTIELDTGWNFISINVHPTDSSIANLFSGYDVDLLKNANGFWKSGQADQLQSLHKISAGTGYLVYMNTAETFSVTGKPMDIQQIDITSFDSGWHLIGVPYQTEKAFSDILDNTNCEVIKDFDGFWIPDETTNSITDFVPGKGYYFYHP